MASLLYLIPLIAIYAIFNSAHGYTHAETSKVMLVSKRNAQKYFSYSENPEVRKPSACFSLNVGMDDFAMCIKAETIVKQVQIKDDALKSFLAKWDKVPKLGRVKRDPEVEALLMERRARFEKELTVCKAEENASARETCIVKLENSYLDEKYGYDSQDKDMILESNTSRQVSGEPFRRSLS